MSSVSRSCPGTSVRTSIRRPVRSVVRRNPRVKTAATAGVSSNLKPAGRAPAVDDDHHSDRRGRRRAPSAPGAVARLAGREPRLGGRASAGRWPGSPPQPNEGTTRTDSDGRFTRRTTRDSYEPATRCACRFRFEPTEQEPTSCPRFDRVCVRRVVSSRHQSSHEVGTNCPPEDDRYRT